MPRISVGAGASNAGANQERALLGYVVGEEAPLVQEGVEPSAGTSFSASERKPEWSGDSPPATESSLQSPAPMMESPSELDPAVSAAQSSSAPSTAGSIPETGSDQPSPQDSLVVASEPESPATPAPALTDGPSEEVPAAGGFLSGPDKAQKLMEDAHAAFTAGNYDVADQLLNEAEESDSTISSEVEEAHRAVEAFRQSNN